jgi:hypothetical protein
MRPGLEHDRLAEPDSCSLLRRTSRRDVARNGLGARKALRVWGLAGSVAALGVMPADAQECSVTGPAGPISTRSVELEVTCPGAPFFKLSESPDYEETAEAGVVVDIDGIGPGGAYADVSIRYPNGVPGGNGVPFAVTADQRELRVLAVLFDFGDGGAPPSYATPAWAEKLVFGGDHDGRGLANSIEHHIEQSTYGTVAVSGEVYPSWVTVSESDPGFFANKEFDFLIALTPGGLLATTARADNVYSNWPDPHGIFEGWAIFDIPVDSGSVLFDTIHDEPRVSTTDSIVVPRYNPATVEGVWLASDPGHTGTNYFSGGSVRYDVSNPNAFVHFIELGTPLPAANAEVIVSYDPRASVRVSDEQMALAAPDTLPETVKFGHLMHELYHGVGWLLNPGGSAIGDLYHTPQQLVDAYGLMAGGAWNRVSIDGVRHYVPANLSAFSKAKLGIVQPHALRYGEDEIALRLHKAEEGDFGGTNARVKLIEVPLHPPAHAGHQQVAEQFPPADRKFSGREYLLLEWRNTATLLENGAYNFDEALPHEGLVAYRVIETDAASRHGDATTTLVRILDATPAFDAFPFDSLTSFWSEDVFSIESSPAPFGEASGVYQLVAGAPWSWKTGDSTSADLTLSANAGEKTVYAKFMDLEGRIVGETTLTLTLEEPAEEPSNAPPVADAGEVQTLVDDDGDGTEAVTLNASASSDADGTVTRWQWYEGAELLATGETPVVSLPVGAHPITLLVYDDQGASDDAQVSVTVLAPNLPPVADAGSDLEFVDAEGDGTESVTLNGTGSYDADGTLVAHGWYEAGTLIASGSMATVELGSGSHDIILVVTDDRGEVGSDPVVVQVLDDVLNPPSGLTAATSGAAVGLAWSDNSNNETGFVVERGTKTKGVVRYAPLASLGPGVTSHSESLGSGSYFFRVQAVGASGASAYSNEVEVRIRSGGGGGKKGR